MYRRIYLDHAATTPLRSEARASMAPYLAEYSHGNPSSLHAEGQRAKRAVDTARAVVAGALGCGFAEVTFTSGGTEADNAAILGVLLAAGPRRRHLIVSAIEHEAVLKTASFAGRLGYTVSIASPDAAGIVSPGAIAALVREDTALVSVMHANNEIGAIQPIREIAETAHAAGALMHTDAVQSFGQIEFKVDDLRADLISVSAHKIYGPKGIGALYVRDGAPIEPFVHGGGQERERRAGTENVAAIAGFGAAVSRMVSERADEAVRLSALRDLMFSEILRVAPEARINGDRIRRLPNNVNVSLPGLDPETVLVGLDMEGVAASAGSACASGSIEPSHVMRALGLRDAEIGATLRFTPGRETTEEEVVEAVQRLKKVIERQGPSRRSEAFSR